MMIKTTLLLMAAAGLTGCAIYPAYPAYPAAPYGAVYEPAAVYVAPPPVFIGGAVHFGHQRGYSRPPTHGHRLHHSRPHLHRPGHHHH